MRNFFLITFLLLLFSCSKGKENLVDLNAFLDQGERTYLVKSNEIFKKNVNKKNKLLISDYNNYNSWSQDHFNSRNYIFPSKVNFDKSKKKLSGKYKKFIIYKNKIIGIENNSNVKIFDENFKNLKSKKIYKRKVYKNYDVQFSLIAYQNKLIIADNLGNIYCLNLEDLSVIWKKNFGISFRSNLKIHKQNVFVINSNSKIFSINVNTGKLNWSFESISKKLKHNSSYQIAIYKDKLFFTNDSAEIYCLDLIGNNIKWSLVLNTPDFKTMPLIFKSSPLTIDDDGTLFISTNYGNSYAINSESGLIKWSVPIYSLNRLFVNNDNILLTFQNRFVILNKKNGDIFFNQKISLKSKKKLDNFESVIIGQNKIYLPTKNGYGFSMKLKDIKNVNQFKMPKDYEDFLFYKKNLFIKTKNSLIKY